MNSKLQDKIFAIAGVVATTIGIVIFIVLLVDIFADGLSVLNWRFLVSFPSRDPQSAGILPALVGTVYLVIIIAVFAFPCAIAAAIYLEEYAKKNWLTNIIEINISNLVGVPSIVYGIIGLWIFIKVLGLGKSILSGGLTLSLLILPLIISSAREAIRAIPASFREASYALGATKWQTVYNTILPAAFPGILTGIILAISRAIGEAAPLIVVGAVAFISFLPISPTDSFTALPIQIFNWISYPQKEFHNLAAAGIIILLLLTVSTNILAIFLRGYFRKKVRW